MPSWSAHLTWPHPDPTDDYLEALTTALAPTAASLGREPDNTLIGVDLTVEAGTLRQAMQTALAAVDNAVRATGHPAPAFTSLEILTVEQHEQRLARPTIPELVGYAEIATMAGVSRQRAAQYADLGGFPPAVVTTQAGPLRVKAQVEQWLATRTRKPGRPRTQQTA